MPTTHHESITPRLHSRSTIESIRAIAIREFYQVTNDANLEWLKCKMNVHKSFIHPRYYGDFQRRYRNEIKKKKNGQKTSTKRKLDHSYHVHDLTETEETNRVSGNKVKQNGKIIGFSKRV